jgi:hypothetical protein
VHNFISRVPFLADSIQRRTKVEGCQKEAFSEALLSSLLPSEHRQLNADELQFPGSELS